MLLAFVRAIQILGGNQFGLLPGAAPHGRVCRTNTVSPPAEPKEVVNRVSENSRGVGMPSQDFPQRRVPPSYRLVIGLVTHSSGYFPDCAGDFL
jgi:hypothetical protein